MASSASIVDENPVILLDTVRDDDEASRSLLFTDPERLIVARDEAEVIPAIEEAAQAARNGMHVAGFVSYEAGYAFHPRRSAPTPGVLPLVWFGLFASPTDVTGNAQSLLPEPDPQPINLNGSRWLTRSEYITGVESIRKLIHEGDVYQINYTAPFRFRIDNHPLELYARLRKAQRVPYAAYVYTGDQHIVSLSPELFFRRDGELITTRPMKGTIRRGRFVDEDLELQAVLSSDAKTQAENLMIVDLVRNDLSIICATGTVKVPRLFTIEKYETLFQMTSTVTGRLKSDTEYPEIFAGLFPSGSVTGAPKIRAMQRIEELESEPRGVYCGAIGYMAPDRQACFSVAIRTTVIEKANASMGTGSGIVWDSVAEMEYDECLLKTAFLSAATRSGPGRIQLIETMRWDGRIDLIDLHMSRLAESATFFDFNIEIAKIRTAVDRATDMLSPEPHRIRLLVDANGNTGIEAQPIPDESEDQMVRAVFADRPVDSRDPYLFHKTTAREVYESQFDRARAAGYEEAILVNEAGQVTEGTRTNVFIRNGDRFVTPARTCGLLAGVYRQHMINSLATVEEAVIYPGDLLGADAIYLCNAVRGMRRAVVERLSESAIESNT